MKRKENAFAAPYGLYPRPRGPILPFRASCPRGIILALLGVAATGCYFLQAGDIRAGIAATDEALRAGKPDVASAYITPTREVAGEPKSIPPLNLGAAELWGEQVRARAARLRASFNSFLNRFGLQTILGGGGIMAFLVGWVVKNKRTVGQLTKYVVSQGKQRLDAAKTEKDRKAVCDSLKREQEEYHVRKPIRREVKKNGGSKA